MFGRRVDGEQGTECGYELPFTSGFCRNRPEGIFRLSRRNGELVRETPRCGDCGAAEVLFHSNDVLGTGERAEFEVFGEEAS